jgi:predicted MFS family arabinose efflux permease
MSAHEPHHALTPGRERATLLTLGAVQFTHILDYMIMMPLGAQLMQVFHISPAQFTHLVAAYGLAAAISGFGGGFVLDRFDRKRSLLVLYFGFSLATLACGLAPNHHWLLVARLAAGAFGGLSGSMVSAMVGDVIPASRRGRALSMVSMSFAMASVLGVPNGTDPRRPLRLARTLLHAGRLRRRESYPCMAGAPSDQHRSARPPAVAADAGNPLSPHSPAGVCRRRRARDGGGCLVPFIAPSMIANVGLTQSQLAYAYSAGGLASFVSMPIVGRLSDRMDKLKLLAWMSGGCVVVALVLTRLGPAPLAVACLVMAAFMVTMSSRFTPAMAMVTNAVAARYRGGFMSVNAALQQAASGLGNVIAGIFVTQHASGRLVGYPALGYAAIGFFTLTVLLAAELRAAAPHVSEPVVAPTPNTPTMEEAA